MWAKIITIKRTKDLNYFSLCALNLFNTRVSQFELNYWNKWTFPWHSNLLRCTCIMPGCDHLQNSLVSFLNKLQRKTVERDGWDFRHVGVVSAPPVYTPPASESREYCLFFRDFDTLFYLLGGFFSHSNLAGWLITHFSMVWQTQNTPLHRL